jgi:hypothetical protein
LGWDYLSEEKVEVRIENVRDVIERRATVQDME